MAQEGVRTASIAATQNGNFSSAPQEFPGQHFYDGRLSGPANGKISDGNDETTEAVGMKNIFSIGESAQGRHPAEGNGEKEQKKTTEKNDNGAAAVVENVGDETL
jgi:hypothetical protein